LSAGPDTVAVGSHDVPGPSAVSGTWRQFWDILILNSTATFRNRYVDTVFGFAWMFLGPLLLFTILYVFVTEIVERFIGVIPDYGVLLLMNVVLFNLFREGTSQGMRSLVGSSGLVRKMQVPRVVLPLSSVAAALYATLANLIVVMAAILIFGIDPMWTWFLLPVIVLAMIVITTGSALLFAGLFVRFRDVGQVWPALSQVIFYASPVIWPLEVLPKHVLWIAQTFNPIAPVLTQARTWIIDPTAPGWFEARGYGIEGWGPFIVLVILLVAGAVVFFREARRAAEDM
jgi:ABC-2 type transport system permease protein